jgi:hypothetical protein
MEQASFDALAKPQQSNFDGKFLIDYDGFIVWLVISRCLFRT